MPDRDEKWWLARPKFTEKRFNPYALEIGRATLAWNDLQENLGRLFSLLVDSPTRTQPLAIWQSNRVDRSKRDMLIAALRNQVTEVYTKYPKLLDDVEWLIGQANSLEDTRNDAVHAPLHLVVDLSVFEGDKSPRQIKDEAQVKPHTLGQNKRATKLASKNVLAEYNWCRDMALTLRDFAANLDDVLCGAKPSWPIRPKLPTRSRRRKG